MSRLFVAFAVALTAAGTARAAAVGWHIRTPSYWPVNAATLALSWVTSRPSGYV
jgi:hypothetical protein